MIWTVAIAEKHWTRTLPLVALAMSAVAIVLASVALTRHSDSPDTTPKPTPYVTRGGPSPSRAPIALPPLLAKVPSPHAAVEVATGHAGGLTWHLYAAMASVIPAATRASLDPALPMSIGPGLTTMVLLDRGSADSGVAGSSGPGGDPRELPTLAIGAFGPGSGFEARVLVGVTTRRGAAIRLTFAEGAAPMTVTTTAHRSFPGLRFFVVEVPAVKIAAIEALDHAGKAFVQADPGALPY
jgi:hypothetical protein